MPKKNNIIFMTVIAVSLIIGGWHLISSMAEADAQEREKPVAVKVMTAGESAFSPQGIYGGFVKGVNQASVAPKINGRIMKINKQEGDFVRQGEAVVILSADELTSQVQGADEMIASLGITLEDTKKYYTQKINEAKKADANKEELKSAKRLKDLQKQSVQNSIDEARGSLRVAQSMAKETIVRAPFDGTIVHMQAETGRLAGPTGELFEIADRSRLEIELWIPEAMERYVELGREVNVSSKDARGEKKDISGKIKSIGLGAQSGSQKVRIQIQLPLDSSARLGQYMDVELPIGDIREHAITVLEQAIVHKYDDAFVWVVENGHAIQKKVILGSNFDGKVEIEEGIQNGSQIVVAGMHNLKENNTVEIYE